MGHIESNFRYCIDNFNYSLLLRHSRLQRKKALRCLNLEKENTTSNIVYQTKKKKLNNPENFIAQLKLEYFHKNLLYLYIDLLHDYQILKLYFNF